MKSVFGTWLRIARGFRRRDLALWLALCSHLMVTFGFPLPAPSHKKPTDGVAYPCQSRPCGCLTSEQCWAGDCCCFTLEEKVAWAEEHRVNPPEHVRPLIESRQGRPATAKPKKKSCCSTEVAPASAASDTPHSTCCQQRNAASPACCQDHAPPAPATCRATSPCTDGAVEDCPHCGAKPQADGGQKKPAPVADSGVRWVVGVFAQKCRGQGPAGLFQLDPAVVPDLTPIRLPEPERGDHTAPRSDRTTSLTHSPPTRPPRSR